MKKIEMLGSDEAVSAALSYILTMTAAVMLMSILLVSYKSLIENSSEIVLYESFDTLGNQIAVKITNFDRIVGAQTSGRELGKLNTTLEIPDKIGNRWYIVNITQDRIILHAMYSFDEVIVPLNVSSSITSNEISSVEEKIRIFYNSTSEAIEFE
jgi:hypothetical protein